MIYKPTIADFGVSAGKAIAMKEEGALTVGL